MEQIALVTITNSMNKMVCKHTTQQDHNLKGSCYPGENSWKCNLVRKIQVSPLLQEKQTTWTVNDELKKNSAEKVLKVTVLYQRATGQW